MFKKSLVVLMLGLFLAGISGLSLAQDQAQQSETAVNVGNQICPVSNEKIDEKLKATYEYDGKIYNFCCKECIDAFKSDPEKYIEKVNEELKSREEKREEKPQGLNKMMPMFPEEAQAHEGNHHSH